MAIRHQMVLQIDPAHTRHVHIGDQACGVTQATGFQKLLRGCEGRGRVTQGI